MDIFEMITSQIMNPETLQDLSNKIEAKPSQLETAVNMIVPSLLSGVNENLQSENGMNNFLSALNDHKGKSSNINQLDLQDGQKILGHLLGTQSKTLSKNVAKQSGLSTSQTNTLMASIAPLLMVALGKQNLNPKTLMKLMKGFSGNQSMVKTAMKLLDANNDGNIFDDLGKIAKGFFKK